METIKPLAQSAIVVDEQWDQALEQALEQIESIPADVVFVFASGEYKGHFADIIRVVRRETGMPLVIGCSAQGIIGTDQELEDLPSLSLLALSLPETTLQPVRLTQAMLESCSRPQDWHEELGIAADEVNAWLIFADPFQMDCEELVEGFSRAYPGVPMIGGLASGSIEERLTNVFLNDEVFDDGAVALAVSGDYTLLPLVSQGCEPIGDAWTITKVRGEGLIEEISNRPAYDVLIDTLQALSPELQRRAQRNLLVGLAADEYQDSFERGSFLIRELRGIDRRSGTLVIGSSPRVGQTIQFQMRDAVNADIDLHAALSQSRMVLRQNLPVAAILCTCTGRGIGMFAVPDHDAGVIARELGHIPVAGLFCSGEIGPVGKRVLLHGFTACAALFVKKMAPFH
ncbi:MAG: FIST C-terminal domain-containing protein [Ktedonobacteraceae bacterium]